MELVDLVIGAEIVAAEVFTLGLLTTAYEQYKDGRSPTWKAAIKELWFTFSRVDVRDLYVIFTENDIGKLQEVCGKYQDAVREYFGSEV